MLRPVVATQLVIIMQLKSKHSSKNKIPGVASSAELPPTENILHMRKWKTWRRDVIVSKKVK